MKAQTAFAPARQELTLRPPSPENFWDGVHRLRQQIEQRAYALFELRGRQAGHDLDDWFKAEKEFLEPVPIEITEHGNALKIRARIPGFSARELRINLEPWVLTIVGIREEKFERLEKPSKVRKELVKKICRTVKLPVAIVPEKAIATLNKDVLEISAEKAESAMSVKGTAA